MKPTSLSQLLTITIALIASGAAHGQTYTISWSSFSGGSEVSTSRDRRAFSVAGESFVGRIESPPLVVQSGFLANPLVRGPVVSVGEGEELPLAYSLSQNYPNPFNPTTHFGFQIAEFGLVTLKVYNILGQEVVTLLDEERPAGRYTVTWKAEGLASGVYFYLLRTTGFAQTRKLVLLR